MNLHFCFRLHMKKYNGNFRIDSTRFKPWNYSSAASYFVTICCKNMEEFFGEIIDDQIQLNELGKIAHEEWLKTFDLRKDMNLRMGAFVVMPNHFHGIVSIGKNPYNWKWQNRFGPQSKNLASIMRGYKSAVTTFARLKNIRFNWQTKYHDHVIRSFDEYMRITKYIKNNPSNWQKRNR
jgi:putative transposase